MGLRPVAIFSILGKVVLKERGLVPRFVVSETNSGASQESMQPSLEIEFARELEAISHDAAFGDVEIVTQRARTVRGTTELLVTVDRPGGADLNLCERISSRIRSRLEPFDVPYALEVQSAGLDRPLVRETDYDRFKGNRVRIVTSLTINGEKTHRGVLRGVRGEVVILETERGERPLPFVTIKSAHLEYDPRGDLQRDKRERKAHASNRHGT